MGISDIKLSQQFKAQTIKSIIAIVLFIVVYFILFICAIALTVASIFGGISIIAAHPSLVTIIFGIGLCSFGLLVLIFLLKFLFKSHKIDNTGFLEITQDDEPALFNLIHEIVEEVGTSFPKKVFLNSEVNASVFYNSSFWSMFFPIRKNLLIGLGLVNCLTKDELKATLAHEFGHFSQKTMKVGSYVYNVNQVIYNMLYDNESYDGLIQKWANISGAFAFFAVIAVKINTGIQWILKKLYDIVNKSYMGLSREMEFHADEIAAHVTGYEPLKSMLLRLSLADYSFNSVLSFYDEKIGEKIKSQNLYKEHRAIMSYLAVESNLLIKNGYPDVTVEDLNKYNKSKLVIEDQWASHPSTEDRIARLEKTNLPAKEISDTSASDVFKNFEATQIELTNKLFNEITYEGETSTFNLDEFKTAYFKSVVDNSFSKIFNSYYDNKNPVLIDTNQIELTNVPTNIQALFSDDVLDKLYEVIALQADINTIQLIADKTIPAKTFDYDGIKYKRKESKSLLPKLEAELEAANKEIITNDIAIYKYFLNYEKEKNETHKLKDLYNALYDYDKAFDDKHKIYLELNNALQFTAEETPFDLIEANFRSAKPFEKEFKVQVNQMLNSPIFKPEITKEIKEVFEKYLSKEWSYFSVDSYNDSNIEMLTIVLNSFSFLLSRGYFLVKKELLDYKANLLEPVESN